VRHLSPQVFEPAPRVAGGVVTVSRRRRPLLPPAHAPAFHAWLRRRFAAGDVGLKRQLRGHLSPRRFVALAQELGFATNARPCDLDRWQWIELYRETALHEEHHHTVSGGSFP
jgi:23S rRNA (adenine-N6)-dimethyltransferase